jgi:hypothetical protein
VPTSDSHRALAAVFDDKRVSSRQPVQAPARSTPLFVVASPRPMVGKTFVARLAADFARLDGRPVKAFDLDPEEGSLADFLPAVTIKADIGNTRGQMALFDHLIVGDGVAKVVDLVHSAFERFFTVVAEIGFIEEARRREVEPVILFIADPHPASAPAYARLRQHLPNVTLVPVFNDGVLKGRKLRDLFPSGRASTLPLHIRALAPLIRAHADKPTHSFADFHAHLPLDVPAAQATELRSWIRRTFLEFRELELRLLLDKLTASLKT